MWNIVVLPWFQGSEDFLISILVLFMVPGCMAFHQTLLGIMADHSKVTPGQRWLITRKFFLACKTNAMPLIKPKSFPPRWINSIWGARPLYSLNNKGNKPAHCIPLRPFHLMMTHWLRPNWEPLLSIWPHATPRLKQKNIREVAKHC